MLGASTPIRDLDDLGAAVAKVQLEGGLKREEMGTVVFRQTSFTLIGGEPIPVYACWHILQTNKYTRKIDKRVYMCVYIYMYMYLYIYTHVYIYIHTHSLFMCISIYIYTCVYRYMYIFMCMLSCTCRCRYM